jgi:hypothetical protein
MELLKHTQLSYLLLVETGTLAKLLPLELICAMLWAWSHCENGEKKNQTLL